MDPVFAEQFAVAHPTERYAQVLDALPDAYVGTDITPVVQFLCAELAAAFEVRWSGAASCSRTRSGPVNLHGNSMSKGDVLNAQCGMSGERPGQAPCQQLDCMLVSVYPLMRSRTACSIEYRH